MITWLFAEKIEKSCMYMYTNTQAYIHIIRCCILRLSHIRYVCIPNIIYTNTHGIKIRQFSLGGTSGGGGGW